MGDGGSPTSPNLAIDARWRSGIISTIYRTVSFGRPGTGPRLQIPVNVQQPSCSTYMAAMSAPAEDVDEGLSKDPEYYISDGNTVLQVENTLFKVCNDIWT